MSEDVVNSPAHYNQAGIEVIDVIETYVPNSPHLANVIKYVCRHSYKGKPLEDLKKARWYLNRAIARMQRQEELQEVLEHARPWSEVRKELEEDYPDPSTFEEHELYIQTNALPPTYVQPSPDRIAGDDDAAKRIKAWYYNYNPGEAVYQCGNPACREVIHTKDAAWSADGVVGKFCSLVCLDMVRATR